MIQNTSLVELNLGSNKLGDEGVALLVTSFKSNQSIQILILGMNEISDKGAQSISDFMKHNSTIKELFLHNNKIGDTGFDSLSESLKENSTLQKLVIWGNKINTVDARIIGKNDQIEVDIAAGNELLSLPSQFRNDNKLIREYLKITKSGGQLDLTNKPNATKNEISKEYSPLQLVFKNAEAKVSEMKKQHDHEIQQYYQQLASRPSYRAFEQDEVSKSITEEQKNSNSRKSEEEKNSTQYILKTILNSAESLKSCEKNKLQFCELHSRFDVDLIKKSENIKIKNEEAQDLVNKTLENLQKAQREYYQHLEKMEFFINQVIELEWNTLSLKNFQKDLQKQHELACQKSDEMKYSFMMASNAMAEITEKNEYNKKFIDDWKKSIEKGNIETWKNEEIDTLLEYLKLEKWSEKISNLSIDSICEPGFVKNMMERVQTNEENIVNKKMSYGEVKLISLALREIKQNKRLVLIENDIDLDEKNMNLWNINNVKAFFDSKNMPNTAKCLQQENVNGFVLLNIEQSEIIYLNFDGQNLAELISFLDMLREWQNKPKKLAEVPPNQLVCSLSKKLMKDPVLASDENTYEREAFNELIKTTSNEKNLKILASNSAIKGLCDEWRKKHPDYQE
eukprot:c20818_g1_i3.p1 GENE.c20818_g1_i3~~c20818_g1_i3.p1  ORF type:complete len:624 (+),score=170.50 c20818_g1_i3:192-2063(+)